jgi:hypothetical protein
VRAENNGFGVEMGLSLFATPDWGAAMQRGLGVSMKVNCGYATTIRKWPRSHHITRQWPFLLFTGTMFPLMSAVVLSLAW